MKCTKPDFGQLEEDCLSLPLPLPLPSSSLDFLLLKNNKDCSNTTINSLGNHLISEETIDPSIQSTIFDFSAYEGQFHIEEAPGIEFNLFVNSSKHLMIKKEGSPPYKLFLSSNGRILFRGWGLEFEKREDGKFNIYDGSSDASQYTLSRFNF